MRFAIYTLALLLTLWSQCQATATDQSITDLVARIDQLIADRLAKDNVVPAPPINDGEYIRRISLDLAGRIPTVAEYDDYVQSTNAEGLIEQIIWSPDQQCIMTAGGDNNGFITIYDAKSGELLHQEGQNGHIHGLACDESFTNIYAASHERVSRWTIT